MGKGGRRVKAAGKERDARKRDRQRQREMKRRETDRETDREEANNGGKRRGASLRYAMLAGSISRLGLGRAQEPPGVSLYMWPETLWAALAVPPHRSFPRALQCLRQLDLQHRQQ